MQSDSIDIFDKIRNKNQSQSHVMSEVANGEQNKQYHLELQHLPDANSLSV